MTQTAAKGIALEIGKMPNLRPLGGPEEILSASHRCVFEAIYVYTSSSISIDLTASRLPMAGT